ncbi:MAG: DUF481 domain-containing protein [Planctomycetota bacterium]
MSRYVLACFTVVLFLAAPATASDETVEVRDRLVLINGETLDGRVVERTADQFVFEHPLLGKLVVPARNVADVETRSPIEPASPEPAAVPEPVTPPVPVAVPIAAAPSLPPTLDGNDEPKDPFLRRLLNPSKLTDWSPQLSLGFTGFEGDTRRQDFYGKLAATRQAPQYVWKFLAESFYSDSPQGSTRDEGRVELTRRWRNPDSPWFLFGTGRYQYNRFKSWQDRIGSYAGIGNTLEVTERFEFTTEAGLGGSYEYGDVDDWTPEAVFAAGGMVWTLTPRQTFRFDTRFFPSLQHRRDYRVEAETDWSFKLDAQTNTHLNLGFRQQYESQTARDDRNDVKYFAALKFSF